MATTNSGITNALQTYHALLYPETALYNGREYNDYNYSFSNGTPYFVADSMTLGSVTYDSILFENVLMKYNIVAEQLVIADPSFVYHIALDSKHVNSFNLLHTDFVNVTADSDKTIRAGYYMVLYGGATTVFKKLRKRIDEKTTITQGITRVVYESNTYYIKKNGSYYSVSRKKQLLGLFAEHKKELQQYLRNNKLNIKRDKDLALIGIAAWYDNLK